MINEQIRDKEIRLIGENGEQLGIMSSRDAMKRLLITENIVMSRQRERKKRRKSRKLLK